MRSLIAEIVLVAIVSTLIVAAALAGLSTAEGATWFGRVTHLVVVAATLQFGNSILAHGPVSTAILAATLQSVRIIGGTVVVLVAIAVPLGVASVTRASSSVVRVLRRAVDLMSGLPILVWGTLMFMLFARQYQIILREDLNLRAAVVVAVFVLAFGDRLLADMVRRVELGTREILSEPYMRTARAADLGVTRHLLQSLVRPVSEAITARAMFLVSGAIVIEMIFTINGLGFTVVNALDRSDREPRVVLAASMALIAIGLVFRVLHRFAATLADPRAGA